MVQVPSLQQAVAVALLLRRRSNAATAELNERCAQLQQEAEQLRAAAAVPPPSPPPLPPLAQLVVQGLHGGLSASAPASASLPHALQAQLDSLRLWHQANLLLAQDAVLQPVLASAQRYAVLKELAEGPTMGQPVTAALERTPVKALLELAADILQAHMAGHDPAAAAAAAALAGQTATQQAAACPPLSPQAHGMLLGAAVACAAHLCCWPGQAASDSCYAALQQFCGLVLQLAASPPPPPPEPSAGAAVGGSSSPPHSLDQQQLGGASGAPASSLPAALGAGPAIDLAQPSCQVAQQALGLLHCYPAAGMVLLSCAAPSTRDCISALAAAVLGDSGMQAAALALSAAPLGSSGSNGSGVAGGAGGDEEARLLHAFAQLSQQLSAGLRLLPQWVQATGLHDDHFLQELASAVLSARDAAQLISLSHPAAARQMQRLAAQMIAALQLLASQGARPGACTGAGV